MKHRLIQELGISCEAQEKLKAYTSLVVAWNRTINLISRADEQQIYERHLYDSLALIPHLPTFERAVDLGSGGGFPGMVLAIATNRHFDLVEADVRKASFLREAARLTGAAVTVHHQRIERVKLLPAPLVTARALATLSTLLCMAQPFLSAEGVCVFPKGRTVLAELAQARQGWHMRIEEWVNPLRPDATILRLSEIARV